MVSGNKKQRPSTAGSSFAKDRVEVQADQAGDDQIPVRDPDSIQRQSASLVFDYDLVP